MSVFGRDLESRNIDGFTHSGGSMKYPNQQPSYSIVSPVDELANYNGSSNSQPTPNWLSDRIEAWFGSVEDFENNVVLVTRIVLMDCLTYPFIAFSRQCQLFLYSPVSVSVSTPFSTVVVLHHIMNLRGVSALWRGWRSHVLLLLVRPFLDALLLKLFRPRSVALIFLKCVPHLITMPILSYTYLEMVQSTKDKVQESLGDTFSQHHLIHQDELRRLPYITLATPTVLHGLSLTLLHHVISRTAKRVIPSFHSSSRTSSSDLRGPLTSAVGALWLDYFSMFLTEVALYPLQTVLVRLYCQGMPALVDNVQSGGSEPVFISSYYRGFIDCVTGILDTEGYLGFFKGFSSLLVKYLIHGLMLFLVWKVVDTLNRKWKRS